MLADMLNNVIFRIIQMKICTQFRIKLLIVLVVCIFNLNVTAEENSVVEQTWKELPSLPNTVGFGGAFIGTYKNSLVVAGGANFPEKNEVVPDGKVWYDDVYILNKDSNEWTNVGSLKRPLGYGAAVSTPNGILLIGGSDHEKVYADVSLLKIENGKVVLKSFPPLPKPSHLHVAEIIQNTVYVVCGRTSLTAGSEENIFWKLDLNKMPDQVFASSPDFKWGSVEAWPGPSRIKAMSAVQSGGGKKKYLYLFGGETSVLTGDGFERKFLSDCWRFDPYAKEGTDAWKQLADLPDRPRAAGGAIDFGQSHILLFGGSSGIHLSKPVNERPFFPNDIIAYHTITNTWVPYGNTVEGIVTVKPVVFDEKIALVSGEIKPGTRTKKSYLMSEVDPKGNFGFVNFSILALYLIVMVGMGFYFAKREKGTEDYFLAGRRIPWWAAGLSIYATQLSAITFVATPSVAYARDWLVYPAKITIFLMAPVIIAFYLPFFRRLNITTAYQYLEMRFSLIVRWFGSLSFCVMQLMRMGIVVYIPALALTVITGIPVHLSIVIMGVLAILYTTLGGIEAVVWTDVLQTVVLLGGMAIAVVICVIDVGGVGAIFNTAAADGKLHIMDIRWDWVEMTSITIFIGTFLLQFAPYTTDQAVIQRYLTTKDEKTAAKSIWMNGFMTIPGSFLFFCSGTCFYVFFKNHPEAIIVGMQNDKIFPLFISNHLPPGISGLVIAGIFAASMSTLDSGMHSIATELTTDFYKRLKPDSSDHNILKVARIITVVVGIIGTGLALLIATYDIKSLFFFFQAVMGLIPSSLVGIFMLGIFSKHANTVGCLIGVGFSIAVSGFIVFYYK